MKQALEALEMLARYENPETRVQVRKPKDGGPIVTMYPHKVATDAADAIRTAIAEAEKQEPHELLCLCGATWCIYADSGEELVNAPPAAKRQWVGLIPEQVRQCFFGTDTPPSSPPYWWEYKDTDYMVIYNIIEAKLKEKNA